MAAVIHSIMSSPQRSGNFLANCSNLHSSFVLIRGRIAPVFLHSWRGYLRSGPTVVTPGTAELDARKVEAIG